MMLGTSNVKISEELLEKSEFCLRQCCARGIKVGFAESCTGGLLTFLFCLQPGASTVVECGLVTYSNDAKEKVLGVCPRELAKHSAVSREVAVGMAKGLLSTMPRINVAVSVTGIAGNSQIAGKNEGNVGHVIIARAERNKQAIVRELKFGNFTRQEIQSKAAMAALDMICSMF